MSDAPLPLFAEGHHNQHVPKGKDYFYTRPKAY